MLRSLSIRDFAIVDRLDLEFARGFTALTGETGAGKSILIEALTLVLGERADPITVRQGADRAEVSATFEVASGTGLARWLHDNEFGADEGQCLLRRVLDRTARSRAFINGRAATLTQLREAGEALLDIHGQNQHQSLTRAQTQRDLVDAFGGLTDLGAEVARAHDEWKLCQARRARLDADASALSAEREALEWQVRDLETLGFVAAEWEALAAEHLRLAHGASLAEAAQYCLEILSEGEDSGLSRLNRAAARLEGLVEYDPALRGMLELLQPAQAQLKEAVYALRRYGERLDIDPQRLREVEQRLEAVHGAARRHRADPERLPDILDGARRRLIELGEAGDVEALRRAESAAHAQCITLARKLSAGRVAAAQRLQERVTETMQTLAMAGGCFEVAVSALDEVTRYGLDQIEFRVAAHKGVAPMVLSKVASGGELSRLSLAIQSVASELAKVPTLIFDEVDAGIGGRVAEIVGKMLRRLGRRHQVMCVTHLPQVAASADHHWRVSKTVVNGATLSRVSILDGEQRIEEIARMLGGVRITATTRKHAAEMLGAPER